MIVYCPSFCELESKGKPHCSRPQADTTLVEAVKRLRLDGNDEHFYPRICTRKEGHGLFELTCSITGTFGHDEYFTV